MSDTSMGKEVKNYNILEVIEMAKNSEYGCLWYSDKGPIQITKEGELIPLRYKNNPKCEDK